MLKVLLVDDEPFILKGLSMIIDWAGEGFEIVDMVSNAQKALVVLKKEQPDLVIADIKMPQMTGLELLAKVRQEKISDAYFVMLSGYSDFEYVKTALQNDCLDYMLKPVDRNELLNVLSKVRALHEEDVRKKLDDTIKEKEVYSRNMISIIQGKFDSDNVEYVKRFLGECEGCRYICAELNLASEEIGAISEADKKKYQRELYQQCRHFLDGEDYRCIFDVSLHENSYDVGIIYSENLNKSTNLDETTYLEHLKNTLERSVGFPIQITVGNKVDSLEHLSESAKTVLMTGSFQRFEVHDGKAPDEAWNFSGKAPEKQHIDELLHAIARNEKENIEGLTKQLWDNLKMTDERVIRMVINYMMFELLHLASDQDENINQQEVFQFINESTLEKINAEDAGENMTNLLQEYGDYLAQLRSNKSKGVLGLVEADMKENYKDNITLKDLGKKYYVNAAYLGQTFKKQYGESFKDYLNRIRIEAAAEKLLHTELKIYEIAEEVGYKDLDYFINKFIALKGCTPAKYRKQMN